MCEFCENKKKEILTIGTKTTDCGAFGIFQTDLDIDCVGNRLIAGTFAKSGSCDFEVVETKINYCPLCGRKLSEETEKPSIDEIFAELKNKLTEDDYEKLNDSIKSFSDGINGLWEILRKGIENG